MISINGPIGYLEFVGNRRVDILRTCRVMTDNSIKIDTGDGIYTFESGIPPLNRLYDSEGKEQSDFVRLVLYR